MLDIKKWKRMDIVYAILSMGISIVIVNIILIQQHGPMSKTIMFVIVSVLLYFLFKYIQEYNNPFNGTSFNVGGVVEDLKTPKGGDKIKNNSTSSKDNSTSSKDDSTSSKDDIPKNVTVESFDSFIETYADKENNQQLYTKLQTYKDTNLSGKSPDGYEQGGDKYGDKLQHLTGSKILPDNMGSVNQNDNHTFTEEENNIASNDNYHFAGEEEDDVDTITPIPPVQVSSYPNVNITSSHPGVSTFSKKEKPTISRDLPKASSTPININISYNTKSSTNTDDIISIKERFSKPDESDHIFHNNIPEVNDMKINTQQNATQQNATQRKIQTNNNTLRNQDTNNNYYKPPNSRCHGSTYNPRTPIRDDKVYSGSNYEYIHPNILENNINNGKHKNNVCPMNINQHWSSWNPQYLSGDDTSNEMVSG